MTSGSKLLLVQEGGYAETYTAYCAHGLLEGIIGTDQLLEDPFGLGHYPDQTEAEASAMVAAVLYGVRGHLQLQEGKGLGVQMRPPVAML